MRIKSLAAAALIAVATLSGCASSANSDNEASKVGLAEPEVLIAQLSTVAQAARHVTGGLPVQYRVQVTNNAGEPITFRRIDVQSIGAGAYTLPSTSRAFNVDVAQQSTKAVDFWASAVVDNDTILGSNGPVSLRVTTYFDSPKGSFTHTTVEQVHSGPTGQ